MLSSKHSSSSSTFFHRSKEAPMEYEYDRPSTTKNIFSTPFISPLSFSSPTTITNSNTNTNTTTSSSSTSSTKQPNNSSAADEREEEEDDDENEHYRIGRRLSRNTGALKRTHSTVSLPPSKPEGNSPAFGSPFLFSSPQTSQCTSRNSSAFNTPANLVTEGLSGLRVRTGAGSEPLTTRAVKKVMRRREREGEKYWRVDNVSDEDEMDAGNERDVKTNRSRNNHMFGAPSFSDSYVDHHNLPFVISGYLQLGFNIFLVAILGYLVMVFIRTVQRDVDLKVEEYSAEILKEMSQCTKDYLENRCSPTDRVPAMEKACRAWESCMNRDPSEVGRAKVSAETFAEIINSFVEPISYKTMAFFVFLLFGSLFLSNLAFGFYRSRSSSHFRDDRRMPAPQAPPPAAQIHLHGGPSSWGPPSSGYSPPPVRLAVANGR